MSNALQNNWFIEMVKSFEKETSVQKGSSNNSRLRRLPITQDMLMINKTGYKNKYIYPTITRNSDYYINNY